MYCFDQLAYALGKPTLQAQLKAKPEDFIVEEQLGFSLSGIGQHLWLWIEKTGQNTDWLIKQLSQTLQLPPAAFGYAGKKDRQAVTRQWLSLQPPKSLNQATIIQTVNRLPGVQCLDAQWHDHKCKIGCHQANHFRLNLPFVSTPNQAELDNISHRLQQLQNQGFPNYFGEQRFGKQMQNLAKGEQFLKHPRKKLPRHLKGLYLSAIRSWLFNTALSQRLQRGYWQTPLTGDLITDQGITAPLPGDGELGTHDQALAFEIQALAPYQHWLDGLARTRMTPDRRPITCHPQTLQWQLTTNALQLNFTLPKGSYATMLIRELIIPL